MAADPQDIASVEGESTSEQRSEFRKDFESILATNMGFVFAGKGANDALTIDQAISGALAMFEFGLVLAEQYPVEATVLIVASQERDEREGLPINTSAAVDAVVQAFKESHTN